MLMLPRTDPLSSHVSPFILSESLPDAEALTELSADHSFYISHRRSLSGGSLTVDTADSQGKRIPISVAGELLEGLNVNDEHVGEGGKPNRIWQWRRWPSLHMRYVMHDPHAESQHYRLITDLGEAHSLSWYLPPSALPQQTTWVADQSRHSMRLM